MTRQASLLFVLITFVCFSTTEAKPRSRFAQTHNRSQYVHWIDLYDANNQRIDPTAPDAAPYSPLTTCRHCHDYQAIASGRHFNAMLDNVPAGPIGEPWIWTDGRTGTQIPLSYRGWKGTYQPDDLGISARDFVLKFGHHLPGGGPGQPPEDASPGQKNNAATNGTAEPSTEVVVDRWKLSGPLNIDCMFCHDNSHAYSPEIWWNQIEAENFAWAATAASGLGYVEGKVSRLPDDFDPAGAEPDSKLQLPETTYTPLRVNTEKKVFFDITRRPNDNACYYCHTTQRVGSGVSPPWTHDDDVHLRAGLTCSDCHRNGIGHHTVRGYEGEEHPTGESVATLSCRGCHMGEAGTGGRLGAPKPLHRGLPALHLERLACTVCHSGPRPSPQARQVQTARAHGLGLPSHDYTAALAPGIVAPVLMQDTGKLYPYRMMWPAFWGRLQDETIVPWNPEAVQKILRRTLRVRRGDTLMQTLTKVRLSSQDKTSLLGEQRAKVDKSEWTEEEKAKIAEFEKSKALASWREKLVKSLTTLRESGSADGSQPVYVGGGRTFRLGDDGQLVEFDHPAALPYAWKLGHDVRPARTASGAKGCYECHAAGTPIFTGEVTAMGAVPEDQPITHSMVELAGYDKQRLDLWNASFQGRPLFKIAGFAAMGIVGLILLASLGRSRAAQPKSHWSPWEKLLYLLTLVSVAILAGTSFGSLLWFGEFRGWSLFAHMLGAGMFVFTLPVLAITWFEPGRFGTGRDDDQGQSQPGPLERIPALLFWIVLTGGLIVSLTMLLSMLPLMGTDGLGKLLDLHYWSGLVVAVALAIHCTLKLMSYIGQRRHSQ